MGAHAPGHLFPLQRRSFLKDCLVGGAVALAPIQIARAVTTRQDDLLRLLHPDLKPLLPMLLESEKAGTDWTAENLAKRREMTSAWQRPFLPGVPAYRKVIPGSRGNPDVTIWVVNAREDGQRPAILHTHGGGMISGNPKMDVPNLQKLAAELDCAVVSVDYRLAPETTFKGSTEDNYARLLWLYRNARGLGVDPARIAVMGESAGGGHAALLAMIARDRGEVPIVFQCLTYPMLDDRTGSSKSVPYPMGELVWTARSNRFGWSSFLGQPAGLAKAPFHAVPARTKDFSKLPPAFILVGTLDLFCLEDIDFARNLNAAGVPAELICIPGAFHAFDILASDTPLGKWAYAAKLDALRRGLAGTAPSA